MDTYQLISIIVSAALAIVTLFAGKYWGMAKVKVEKVQALLKIVSDAYADNTITPEEVEAIVKAAKAIVEE